MWSQSLRLGFVLAFVSIQGLLLALIPKASTLVLGFSAVPLVAVLGSAVDFEALAVEFSKLGVNARAPATIPGKSGVSHIFAFAVIGTSNRPKVVVDTELSVKEVDEMRVLKFYVKVYDVSPEKAILCVCPTLSERGRTLAKEYGVSVLESEVPKKLVSMAAEAVGKFTGTI